MCSDLFKIENTNWNAAHLVQNKQKKQIKNTEIKMKNQKMLLQKYFVRGWRKGRGWNWSTKATRNNNFKKVCKNCNITCCTKTLHTTEITEQKKNNMPIIGENYAYRHIIKIRETLWCNKFVLNIKILDMR